MGRERRAAEVQVQRLLVLGEWTNNFNAELKKYKDAAPSYDDLVDSNVARSALAKVGEVSPSEK